MLKNLAKRERTIFLVAVTVIFLLFCSYLFTPMVDKIIGLDKEISASRLKLKNYYLLLSRKEIIRNKYADFVLAGYFNKHDNETISIVSELENLCKSAGARIVEIRPKDKAEGSIGLIEARTIGTTENYLKLFYDMENSPYLLRVKKVQISFRKDDGLLDGVLVVSPL